MSLVLFATAALTGCGPLTSHVHRQPLADPPRPAPPDLPVVARKPVEPDVSAVPLEPSLIQGRPPSYRQLTAAECRTLAMRNAPLADDLDNHPENLPPNHPLRHKKAEQSALGRTVRGYAADESRNRAAGDALEDYFKLLAAEAMHDLLSKSHAELRSQLASAEKAAAVGVRERGTIDDLRRQVFDTEAQIAKAESGIGGINPSLRGRLGLPPDDPLPIWPDDPLRVRPDVPDPNAAVKTGLLYRSDLNLLRVMLADSGTTGLELMRAVLGGVNPLLATASVGLLGKLFHGDEKSADATRRQVAGLLAARERQAEAEIRAATANVAGQRAAVAARAAAVRQAAARMDELEKRQRAGQEVAADLLKARLELLKARGELLQIAAEWHIADVKLRQAMGVLVRE